MSDNHTATVQLIFTVPGKDAPGFARRARRALELQELQVTTPSKETLEQIVDFLADYVQAENHKAAVELVWDASERQWEEMLEALGGASAQIPPPKLDTSVMP